MHNESITGYQEELEAAVGDDPGTVFVDDDGMAKIVGPDNEPESMPEAHAPQACRVCGFVPSAEYRGWLVLQSTPPIFFIFVCPDCGSFVAPGNVWDLATAFERLKRADAIRKANEQAEMVITEMAENNKTCYCAPGECADGCEIE
jgi:hypothetical protein